MVSEPLSDERLTEIRERLGRATPGEWEWPADHCDSFTVVAWTEVDEDGEGFGSPNDIVATTEEDAALIAAAPNDLRDLLAEVDRLRALIQPDLSEEKELAAIRRYMAENDFRRGPRSLPSEPTSRWSDMVHYLLDRLAATQGVLADALSESGARQAGAAEERRRCLAALEAERKHWPNGMTSAGETIFGCCRDALATLPDLPAPLPPEAARIRADAMESILRRMLGALCGSQEIAALQIEVRKLLGETK